MRVWNPKIYSFSLRSSYLLPPFSSKVRELFFSWYFVLLFSWIVQNSDDVLVLCQTLKSLKVRVSVIGLSAEVRVCTVLTRETGGSYHVILDESHFKELLMLHVKPPPASSSSECSLIRMGQYVDAGSVLVNVKAEESSVIKAEQCTAANNVIIQLCNNQN